MNILDYSRKYLKKSSLIKELDLKNFKVFLNELTRIKNKRKVILIGNGGSAAMSSHVSVDLTNNVELEQLILMRLILQLVMQTITVMIIG